MKLGECMYGGYLFELHSTAQSGILHYHLLLQPHQKDDVKDIKTFKNVHQVISAHLNKTLETILLNMFIREKIPYVKVEKPKIECNNVTLYIDGKEVKGW